MDELKNLRNRERHVLCTEDFFAQAEERQEQNELNGVHEVVHDLNRRKIQAQNECGDCAKRSCPAKCGKHSQCGTECNTQSNFFRRHALTQQIQKRAHELTVNEGFFHRIMLPFAGRAHPLVGRLSN